MLKIQRALWHIESRLADATLTMEDVAAAAGVSRFHLSRLFASTLGRSAVSYVRSRRLSEAAIALTSGRANILDVALAAGFETHEAFTRAFKKELGVTPEAVRAARSTKDLMLTHAHRQIESRLIELAPPRQDTAPLRLLAGIARRFTGEQGIVGIPQQWRELAPYFGHVPGAVGDTGYGVYYAFDHENAFSYLAGIEVSRFSDLPQEFETLRLEQHAHVVFVHRGHVNDVPATMRAIWETWAPERGYSPANSHAFFERYDDRFNPETGEGVVEIWIPIEEKIV
jgi:AraC family transcriptional regulator